MTDTDLTLQEIRERIDQIDRELVDLLAERMDRSMEIGRAKASAGIPLHAPLRERQVIDAATDRAIDAGLDPRSVRLLYRLVVEHSRAAQRRAADEWVPRASIA